ncbi:MAG: DUF368 domain-containing protein [Candidatus Woesearchaeota archaeon]
MKKPISKTGILWRGALIGVADIIPGISGGTIALITGVYQRFIHALKQLTKTPLYAYNIARGQTTTREVREELDLFFILPLLAAILAAILLASRLIPELMSVYPQETFVFFIALIITASIAIIRKETTTKNLWALLTLGILIGATLALLAPTNPQNTPLALLIAGILALSAMLLPGISGSAVLFILGQYTYVLLAIREPLSHARELTAFVIGAVIGVTIITRVITYVLRVARKQTISFLAGLMLGALIAPAKTLIPISNPATFTTSLVAGLLLGAVLLLAQLRSEKQEPLAASETH